MQAIVNEQNLTIIEVIQRSEIYLKKKGIEFPKLDAEWMTAHAMGCSRLDLYLRFEEVLTPEQTLKVRNMVIKRGQRVPLQYIFAVMDFSEISLKVDQRALIPRPETEFLIEVVCERLVNDFDGQVADLGTGTGAIILSLAKRFPKLKGYGFEKSSQALELFKENREFCQLNDNVKCQHFDWNKDTLGDRSFDLIISNPPYLTEEEWNDAQPEISKYEPVDALIAGENGFSDIRKVVNLAKSALKEKGMIALEVGMHHPSKVKKILGDQFDVSIIKDLNKKERYVIATR
jgi:release factor glutamine methyltransferase